MEPDKGSRRGARTKFGETPHDVCLLRGEFEASLFVDRAMLALRKSEAYIPATDPHSDRMLNSSARQGSLISGFLAWSRFNLEDRR